MSDRPGQPRSVLDDADCKANCQFKRKWASAVPLAVILSVAAHVGMVESFPRVEAADMSRKAESATKVVKMPPRVEVPSPPAQVPRPSEPKVATTDVIPEATIQPTEFDRQPKKRSMPAPPKVEDTTGDRPAFVPRDVDPELKNESELRKLLKRHYPPALAEAGIGGKVVVWVFVDADGEVAETQVRRSSGYERLDRAARKVARKMDFEPARSRDKPIGVWVTQIITFRPAQVD